MSAKKTRTGPERLAVKLAGGRGYPIVIGHGKIDELGRYAMKSSPRSRFFIVTDKRVAKLHGRRVLQSFEKAGAREAKIKAVAAGEASKSFDVWRGLVDDLVGFNADAMEAPVVACLGGGVIGDLGGFLAATYRRGVPLVHIPTTLLAQVDSSVGGKTGIDHRAGKNLIGSFYQPKAVLIDTAFLETLPSKQVRNGLAEVVKYALISDARLLGRLERNTAAVMELDPGHLAHIVRRACAIKARIVSIDETETLGHRTLLNLGHTVGHAIEAAGQYRRYGHGEAVAAGMVCAARLSERLGYLKSAACERIEQLLIALGLPTRIRGVSFDKLWPALLRDKKFISGRIRLVLPVRIGLSRVFDDVDEGAVRDVVRSRMG
ncbi:3-dehydroquinate synthase [Thermodesulfobacteriota bacterium]